LAGKLLYFCDRIVLDRKTGMAEVDFERRGAVGIIVLNRPKVLNALTHAMIKAIRTRLAAWAVDDGVAAVVVRGEGPRAFCAGGDIRMFYESAGNRDFRVQEFWHDEYTLMIEIERYPKPYIALLHGIAMGGGLGISLHGGYRVADDGLTLAMPETGIGFFPDVGASWFLSHCPGETGTYLAMSGARIGRDDALALGLVNRALPQEKWPELIDALAAGEEISDLLHPARPAELSPLLAVRRAEIDAAFSAPTAEEVLRRWDADGSDWAAAAAKTIRSRSPTSVKIALRAVREGRGLSFGDCMRMEFRVACHLTAKPDFREGIRATIIDKDGKPNWRPAELAAVADEEVAACFSPLPEGELERGTNGGNRISYEAHD
jgi:enoyl-CoA hydratase